MKSIKWYITRSNEQGINSQTNFQITIQWIKIEDKSTKVLWIWFEIRYLQLSKWIYKDLQKDNSKKDDQGGDWEDSHPLPEKLACPFPCSLTVLTQKCWFCVFHAIFGHFAQIVASNLSMRPTRLCSCRQACRQMNLPEQFIGQAFQQILLKLALAKVFFFSRLKRDLSLNFCVSHKKSKIMNWTKHSTTTIYM